MKRERKYERDEREQSGELCRRAVAVQGSLYKGHDEVGFAEVAESFDEPRGSGVEQGEGSVDGSSGDTA